MFKHLDSLKELNTQASQFKHKRTQESEHYFQTGIQLLEKAIAQEFSDPNALGDAADAIALALKYNTQNPELFRIMGYLLILVEDFYEALRFLRAALKLAPDDQFAQDLLSYAQSQLLKEKLSETDSGIETLDKSLFKPKEDLDYDELYDEIEKIIQSEVRQMMLDALPFDKPTKDKVFYQKLKQRLSHLDNQYNEISSNIQIVDLEIEASDLKNQLKPMEIQLKRYSTCLAYCQKYQDLDAQIIALAQQVIELTQHLKKELLNAELSDLEHKIELIMDTCDTLADQLESFEKIGYSIDSLEQDYTELVDQIEKLNESFDDASAKNQT
jgi:hypothetical protein